MLRGIDQRYYDAAIGSMHRVGMAMLKPTDYEVLVPDNSWRRGEHIIPEGARDRVRQLELWSMLYEGDYSYFLEHYEVTMNFHRLTAVFLADTLMSRPPEFEYAGELPVTPQFLESMLDAMHCVIVDMARYGVGLFNIVGDQENGYFVEAPQPVYWFPLERRGTAFVRKIGKDFIEVSYDYGLGQVNIDTFETAQNAEMLGNLVDQTVLEVGDPAAWFAAEDQSTGRVSTFINVPRRPATGDWGTGLYPDITPLAVEFNRRMTQNSEILNEHGNPKILLIPEQNNNVVGQMADPDNRGETLRFKTFTNELNNQRKEVVITLPKGFQDARYLEWRGSLRDHIMASHLIQEQLFAATYIPAALYGLGTERPNPSGVALSKQYLRTSIYVQNSQETLIKAIRKVMIVGALMNGLGADEVTRFAEGLEITWPNIFDEDDLTIQDGEEETEDDGNEEEIIEEAPVEGDLE